MAVIKQPVATKPAQVYFIHADHLNTPRVIVDQTNAPVWRWNNQNAFGNNPPIEDPDNNHRPFEYNLRFAGQYFDKETQLHYNYFRDYDPVTGRYLSSDPIGLAGGNNTYGYALQNPLSFIDPTGENPLAGAIAAALACARNAACRNVVKEGIKNLKKTIEMHRKTASKKDLKEA
ncbi:MAG: RHS repeat-associated core domain-containing protein, partial [Gammaproteobacteria bacterium]|nr:RHS repeat-associated core domain-containing protein [Gammaproteobacteria bacterium]